MISTNKKLYLRKKCYKIPTYKKVSKFYYKGFEITIWNNKYWTFRYEYRCKPVTTQTKTMMVMNKYNKQPWSKKELVDRTSHRTIDNAIYSAMENVNEFMSPFYLYHANIKYSRGLS